MTDISKVPFTCAEWMEHTIPKRDEDRLDEADRLTGAARELDAPPQYEAGNHVHVRGEALGKPIYWQGRQWAVTPHGVERRDGTYSIAADRLWEREAGTALNDGVRH